MLDSMPEKTFRRWQEFWRSEPFGSQVTNLMMAQIAAAAAHSEKVSDFLPQTE